MTTRLEVEECYRRIEALYENHAVLDEEYAGKAARTPRFTGAASLEGFSICAGSKGSEGISFYGEASGRFVPGDGGTRALVRLALGRGDKRFLLAVFACLIMFTIPAMVALLVRGNAVLLACAVFVAAFITRSHCGQIERNNQTNLRSVIQALEAVETAPPVITELWEEWRLAERSRFFWSLITGQLLPQAKSAIRSLHTPVCRELVTGLSPEECRERLISALYPFSLPGFLREDPLAGSPFDIPPKEQPLMGTVTDAGFSLHLSQPIVGGLFWPASGRFARSHDGTHMIVHLGLHRLRWSSIWLISSLAMWLFLGIPNPVGLVVAVPLSAAVLSAVVGSRQPVTAEEDNELIGLLGKILAATEVVPASPRTERPTGLGLQGTRILEVSVEQGLTPPTVAPAIVEAVCPNCHASGCVSRIADTLGLADMFPMPPEPSYSPPWAPTQAGRTVRVVFEKELLPNAMAFAGLFLSALVQLVIGVSAVRLEGELLLLDAILLSIPLLFGSWAVIVDYRILKSLDSAARDKFAADLLAWEKASARWRTMLRCQLCLHLFLPGQSSSVPEQKMSSLLYAR